MSHLWLIVKIDVGYNQYIWSITISSTLPHTLNLQASLSNQVRESFPLCCDYFVPSLSWTMTRCIVTSSHSKQPNLRLTESVPFLDIMTESIQQDGTTPHLLLVFVDEPDAWSMRHLAVQSSHLGTLTVIGCLGQASLSHCSLRL